jgi:DNA-directed RNA polymerase subunit RPC12/RpoP
VTRERRRARIEVDPGKEAEIFETVRSSPLDDTFGTGVTPGSGTYFCVRCGSQLALRETDELPECSNCGADRFGRDSIFESMQEHGLTREFPISTEGRPPDWLGKAREAVTRPGPYLACRDEDGEMTTFAIKRGWTRIGRSAKADVRLDHPSVSRRHALIIAEPDKELRVLDDRSLNGVFINGEQVDWGTLHDGDELTVGQYGLYVLRA